jgi:hypothetical protein
MIYTRDQVRGLPVDKYRYCINLGLMFRLLDVCKVVKQLRRLRLLEILVIRLRFRLLLRSFQKFEEFQIKKKEECGF